MKNRMPLPDQNVRSDLRLPSVFLARGKGGKKAINPHTRQNSTEKKRKPRRPLPQTKTTSGKRPPIASHDFTAVLPPPCCSFLSPPQHLPQRTTRHAIPENCQRRARKTQHTLGTQTRESKQAKRKEGVVSIYSFQTGQQKIAKKEDQRGIDGRKQQQGIYIQQQQKQQHQHQVVPNGQRKTAPPHRLFRVPTLFPVPSPVFRHTEKKIFSKNKYGRRISSSTSEFRFGSSSFGRGLVVSLGASFRWDETAHIYWQKSSRQCVLPPSSNVPTKPRGISHTSIIIIPLPSLSSFMSHSTHNAAPHTPPAPHAAPSSPTRPGADARS
jgi:hypothetical protein